MARRPYRLFPRTLTTVAPTSRPTVVIVFCAPQVLFPAIANLLGGEPDSVAVRGARAEHQHIPVVIGEAQHAFGRAEGLRSCAHRIPRKSRAVLTSCSRNPGRSRRRGHGRSYPRLPPETAAKRRHIRPPLPAVRTSAPAGRCIADKEAACAVKFRICSFAREGPAACRGAACCGRHRCGEETRGASCWHEFRR